MMGMKIGKTIGEQLADLVQREPQNCDVIFSVGPEKTKVPAVKIILKAASSIFEKEFKDKWESTVMKGGDGILLPDVDPVAFELFVNLIISDTWSADSLKELNLAPPTALNLLGLCRRFEISKAIENVEAALHDFIQHFASFMDTSDFLKMSQDSLETILSCERIPMSEKEIFECACRWAEHQCQEKMMELTGENFRDVLGNCFFEIRFPTMNLEDFTEVSMLKQNMFTDLEKLAVYEFMGLGKAKKAKYDKTAFKTNPRNSFDCSVLQVPQHFKITKTASFLCHGNLMENRFQVNKKISLLGLGFLGPLEGDTQYDVTVQIKRVTNEYIVFYSGKFKKHIFVRKGRMFHFLFEEPIPVEPNRYYDSSWQTCYCIDFSLKGANNVPQYKAEIVGSEFIEISDVEFNLCSRWGKSVGCSGGSPLAELLFK